MDSLPPLPSSASGSSNTSQASDATSTASSSTRSLSRSPTAEYPTTRYEAHIDFLVNEVQNIRDAWYTERQRYFATDLELDRLTKLLEACDAAYRCLVYNQGVDPETPLTALAKKTLDKWASNEHTARLQALDKHVKERSASFKQKCHDFLVTNQAYSDAAKAYFTEVENFSTWTAARACQLRTEYSKYCALMKDQGVEPLPIYEENDSLEVLQEAFYEAWDRREQALHKAMQIAHLDGRPDLLAGLFTH